MFTLWFTGLSLNQSRAVIARLVSNSRFQFVYCSLLVVKVARLLGAFPTGFAGEPATTIPSATGFSTTELANTFDLVNKNVAAIHQTLQASSELAQLAESQKSELEYFRV